jgi:prepilin-type N-terminal cleavage/methylation domain-containing protein
MLQKIRGNSKGFTLIELMIVIAIIGILAAIAIPNFISYRNKAYCSAAESDAANTAAAIADYYAIPNHTAIIVFSELGISTSNGNVVLLGTDIDAITITVTDTSGRCPAGYQTSQAPQWNGSNVFSKEM